ncbi:uncharacterized protein LOC120780119 isoform X2 [Bactrocera tryoni]|uniref:uncharacterized protein LOC120780119 isoform X2 n=1 Tax=Bactrocera tryoni TaxID=59916 RepID=UPI001A9750BD|nr:uncharacterized protein LOC120780119 isoform X2 [Bactrocera tryoni]
MSPSFHSSADNGGWTNFGNVYATKRYSPHPTNGSKCHKDHKVALQKQPFSLNSSYKLQFTRYDEKNYFTKSYKSFGCRLESCDDDPEDSVPLAVLNEKWGAGLRALMSNTADLLNSLNAEAELTLPGVHEWNEDIEDDDANDEHEEEDDSDEGSVSEVEEKIKRTEAVEIFNKAIMM